MSVPIKHIAEELKQTLREDTAKGAKELIEFARTYTVENKLQHDALILKLNFTKATETAPRQRAVAEMIGLVDRIERDYQQQGRSEEVQKIKAAREQLETHFAKQKVPDSVVVSASGLGKSFPSSNFSLKNINLEIRLGEITSVVGENGNGKTTLLRILVGELRANRGKLIYPTFQEKTRAGTIKWARVKQQIAYVPQGLPSWDGSLKQMIQFEAAVHGIRGKENHREVDYIIQRLGLEDHIGKSWKQLSGGFKLRFALARALVWKPRLLVIDEPLANLDIKTQLVILKDIRALANSFRYPMAVLLSSQHLHEIEAVSDKILFLKDGAVTFYGKVNELGNARHYNTFEFNTEASLQELKLLFQDFPHEKFYHNGISYVIITPLEVDERRLLLHLLNNNVQVDYFRNISHSIKKLFEL